MATSTTTEQRSPLTVLVGALVAVGLVRAAGRVVGLLALLGVVASTVVALAVGILVLRITLQ